MGDIYIALGGGGGISSDEVTAASSHVLQGETYVGVDTDDEIGIGTMPNNPTQNVALDCGQSVTIPLGFNPGSTITANSLASQTGGATADDSKVLSSYTYWKDGIKRTGNLSVTSVVSFNVAQYSNLTLIASWAKPSKGPWSGLRVMCKQGGHPSNVNDGTLFYEGSGTSATKSLASGTWYFRAWNYLTTSMGRMYGGYLQASTNNSVIKGQQKFTSSGTYTVPASVRSVEIFCVGGGGSGASSNDGGLGHYCGGGGGGGYTKTGTYTVTPGSSYVVTVGAGGKGVAAAAGNSGGTTSVGTLISAAGGGNGHTPQEKSQCFGGDGGSGGGGSSGSSSIAGGAGGSNGSDGLSSGSSSSRGRGGKGQGTTTREFGSSSGTLYSGGGAGGHYWNGDTVASGGAGGGGEGACGAHGAGYGGSANTGGGGGGSKVLWGGGNGGSGIVIIRWGY